MSPKDDAENWRTAMRFSRWLKSQPLLIAAMAYALGGGSSTLMDKIRPEKTDPRMDTIMVAVREFKVVQAKIGPLQDTVISLGERVTMIEDRDAREAYLPPRKRSLGRGWER